MLALALMFLILIAVCVAVVVSMVTFAAQGLIVTPILGVIVLLHLGPLFRHLQSEFRRAADDRHLKKSLRGQPERLEIPRAMIAANRRRRITVIR